MTSRCGSREDLEKRYKMKPDDLSDGECQALDTSGELQQVM